MQQDFYEMVLWNRVIGHQGFLTLRVGVGNIPLNAQLSFQNKRFSIDDDVLREESIGSVKKNRLYQVYQWYILS